MSAELLSATMGEPYFKAYQRDYLADRSNRKALCKSRRIGGTEVAAAETAACAAGFDITTGSVAAPRGQIVVSASQNHSREYLSRCKHVLRGFERVTGPLISEGGDQVFRIDLLNGRSIVALPANPNALRKDRKSVV